MSEQNKLKFQMMLFFFFIFTAFSSIVTIEKLAPLKAKKIDEKLKKYINEKYNDKVDEFKYGNTEYKDTKFQLKVYNKKNKDYYFILYYKNKKITSTYNKDYIKGEKYLKKVEKKLEKQINNKTKNTYSVKIDYTLDELNNYNREKLIKNDNLISSKLYTLNFEFIVNDYTYENIYQKIIDINDELLKSEINPKKYEFTIYSKKDNKKQLVIKNLNQDILKSDDTNQIINDIINLKKSDILKKYHIKYSY